MNALVFDIGGTNLRIALTDGKKIGKPILVPAPRSFAGVTETLARSGKIMAGNNKINAVAGGLAGPLDTNKSSLARSTHLKYLVGKPMKQTLERVFDAHIVLENDNALAGIGEATHGAGKGYSIMAYIGIGTGIGGCRIIDGKLDRNAQGFEPGHHFINYDVQRHKHQSAHPGDWESLVSGTGMEVRFGRRAETIRDKIIWDEMAYLTALGLINVAMFWSPDIIVVGGSMMKSIPLARIRYYADKHQKIFPQMPPIVRATLGDFGGLYGAMELARRL